MSEHTYKALRQELLDRYQAKDYSQALALIEQEQAHFPDDAQDISYWLTSLYALLGKPEEALHVMRMSLDKGLWFPPAWLESASDLVSLHSLPAFQEIIEICRQHLARMQSEARPALLVRHPAEPCRTLPLLIAMHGNGNNMHTTIDCWSEITEDGWLLAVPQSSQIAGPEAFVWDEQRERSTKEIREHLAALNKDYTIDPERVVLGGFSAGGGQAIWMALHQSVKTRGFVVLGPYLPEAELKTLAALLETHSPTGLRGTILVGEDDPFCLPFSRKIAEIMHTHHLPCFLEVRPGLDHRYPADFAAWVAKGVAFVEEA